MSATRAASSWQSIPEQHTDHQAERPRAAVKRVLDILGCLSIILFISPVLLALVIGLWVSGDGPVFFSQKRIGRGGAAFSCLKFRTMCVNADRVLADLLERDPARKAEWIRMGKLADDPRVSKVGRVLRATSLDELPQLWNVLRGDMSLVGPRPVTSRELDGPYTTYGGRQDYLSVRPGITGLWQVSGRSNVSYENRVAMDMAYVRDGSMLKDARILLRTVSVVLRSDGAR